jgi:putative membrane protein
VTDGQQKSSEVDYRFLLANERTFLAWMRTSLALIAGGVALDQFVVVANARQLVTVLGVFAISLGAITAVLGIVQWRRADRAMRRGAPMNSSTTVMTLGAVLAVFALAIALLLGLG